jgi:hypothetical protein
MTYTHPTTAQWLVDDRQREFERRADHSRLRREVHRQRRRHR